MSPKKLRRPRGETRERVLAFVRERVLAGAPPTVREVQQALGLRAVQSAREQLDKLVAEGRLVHERGVARGYRLPEGESAPTTLVPLLGRVAAGALSEAIEDRQGFVQVELARHGSLARKRARDLFALCVHGESMRDAGIFDGDLAIVRRQATAENGDIVVALVGDEATVKRLRVRRNQVELHPENPAFAPIVVAAGELRLLGRVIEIRRYLDAGT